jgi:hypothetical protein
MAGVNLPRRRESKRHGIEYRRLSVTECGLLVGVKSLTFGEVARYGRNHALHAMHAYEHFFASLLLFLNENVLVFYLPVQRTGIFPSFYTMYLPFF